MKISLICEQLKNLLNLLNLQDKKFCSNLFPLIILWFSSLLLCFLSRSSILSGSLSRFSGRSCSLSSSTLCGSLNRSGRRSWCSRSFVGGDKRRHPRSGAAAFRLHYLQRVGGNLLGGLAVAQQVQSHVKRVTERRRVCLVLAHEVVGGAVVGRGAYDVESGSEAHPAHVHRLERYESLVVVHGKDGIEAQIMAGAEEAVGGIRTES